MRDHGALALRTLLKASLLLGVVCLGCTTVKRRHHQHVLGTFVALGQDILVCTIMARVSRSLVTQVSKCGSTMAVMAVMAVMVAAVAIFLGMTVLTIADAVFFVRMGEVLHVPTVAFVFGVQRTAILKAIRAQVPVDLLAFSVRQYH